MHKWATSWGADCLIFLPLLHFNTLSNCETLESFSSFSIFNLWTAKERMREIERERERINEGRGKESVFVQTHARWCASLPLSHTLHTRYTHTKCRLRFGTKETAASDYLSSQIYSFRKFSLLSSRIREFSSFAIFDVIARLVKCSCIFLVIGYIFNLPKEIESVRNKVNSPSRSSCRACFVFNSVPSHCYLY